MLKYFYKLGILTIFVSIINIFTMKKLKVLIVFVLLAHTSINAQLNNTKEPKMKVAVWDTYVTKKDGKVMHFDIIAPENVKDTTIIYDYGKKYLKTKGQEGQPLTSKQCRFCHIAMVRPKWEIAIKKQGFYIIEMENCN